MNIALFTDTYSPQINGVVTSTLILKQELERLGHHVYVFAPKLKGQKDDDGSIFRFTSVPYPFLKEHRIVLPLSRQLRHFKKLDIDIIHLQTPFALGFLGLYFARRHKIPVVHTYHTLFMAYLHYVPVLPKKILEKYAQTHSQRFCNRCDALIVPSTQMKAHLEEMKIKRSVEILPTGIQTPTLDVQKKEAIRKVYDINPDCPNFIYVGRLAMEKNLFFLIRAFNTIKQKVTNARLFLIGDGPIREDLESQIKYFGLQDSVVFTGYVPYEDVFYFFDLVDVLLFSSKTETQGLSIVESFAFKTPAVCINQMGVQDVLEGQKGGFLVEEDEHVFAKHAIDLIEDKALYANKSQEAALVAKAFSSEIMAKKMIAFYKTCIRQKTTV